MSWTVRTGRYGKPAAMMAASLRQVPLSWPGNGCEPRFSVQCRIWLNPSMAAIHCGAPPWHGEAAIPTVNREFTNRQTGAKRFRDRGPVRPSNPPYSP